MKVPDDKKFLVSFDTDSIKDYIFATNGLKEIRGASAILREQDWKRRKYSGIVFTAGGGGALEENSPEKAESRAKEIQLNFLRETRSATITALFVDPEEVEDSDAFTQKMQKAFAKQNLAKREKAKLIELPIEPYFRLCDLCGVRAASERRPKDDGQPLVCASCSHKREIGIKVRNDPNYKFGFLHEFREYVKNKPNKDALDQEWLKATLVESLEELGKIDSSGYVGFINMDGNQMGMLLRHIYQKEKLTKYSETLEKWMPELVYQTLIEVSKPIKAEDGQKLLPFEVVLIGGDDVKLFTTADIAMAFTTKLMTAFEKASVELLMAAGLTREALIENRNTILTEVLELLQKIAFYKTQKLTMSAGVVFCHPNFPVPALVEIAEELLKNAKKFCAKMGDDEMSYREGAIDFQVITGSAMALEQAREVMVHNRPYTLSQARELFDHALDFSKSDFPKSQLQMLYEACHQSKGEGTMTTLRLLARLKKKEHRDLLRSFLKAFSYSRVDQPTLWPWVMNGKDHKSLRTSITDLIEILDFVTPRNK